MKSNKRFKPVYLAYLIVLLVGFFLAKAALDLITKRIESGSTRPAGLPAPIEPPALVAPEVSVEEETIAQEIVSPLPVREKKQVPQLSLSGIFFHEKQPCALINGRILKGGDIIKGAQVTSITRERVYLIYEGQSFQLSTR